MDVYKNSNGDYICKRCNVVYPNLKDALDCAEIHKKSDENVSGLMIRGSAAEDVNEYKKELKEGNLLGAATKLCLSMIEDYHVSKATDLQSKEKVGAITMKLAENAANALSQLTKAMYGEKKSSVHMHLDGKRQTDVDALKDAILGKAIDISPEKEEPEKEEPQE